MLNKKYLLIIFAGVFFMLNISGCADGFKYQQYSNNDLNITMDYISNWNFVENNPQKNVYLGGAVFFEDIKGDVIKALMDLSVTPAVTPGGAVVTIEGLADDIIGKRSKLSNSKFISKSKNKLLGQDAVDIMVSYKMLDKISTVGSKLLPVKERIIITIKDNKIFSIRYRHKVEEFDKYNKAFNHIIKSIK